MIAELPIPNYLYCPDTTEFQISGDGITDNLYSLSVYINVTDQAISQDVVKKTQVLTAGVFRYFNPQEYLSNGY